MTKLENKRIGRAENRASIGCRQKGAAVGG